LKLSEIRELLDRRGIQLTKSLGQNFLHDANQLRRIVEAAELSKKDKVLEIGPGLGPLTELLLENAGEVLAIEKDGRLVEFLRERFLDSEGRVPRVPNQKSGTRGTRPSEDQADFTSPPVHSSPARPRAAG
jgi:protein-L-isoaspartate O-methyltransferase